MLEGTRIVQIYVRAEGPVEPRFGDEIDDNAVNDYAYDGWLPLTLSPRDEHGRQHATVIGDPWLSRPTGADAAPDPGPAPVRITAAECSTELRERARLGLRYFIEETPEERGEPYDRQQIGQDIKEDIQQSLEALDTDRATHAAVGHHAVDHLEVTIAGLKRVLATNTGGGERGGVRADGDQPPALDDTCHAAVREFVASHHQQLVEYIEHRMHEARTRLRHLLQAALRLGAFDD